MSTEKLFICDGDCEKILFQYYCGDGFVWCKDCYFIISEVGRVQKDLLDLKNENLALKKEFIFDKLLRDAGLYTDLIGLVFEYMPPKKHTPHRTAVLCEKCNVYCYPNPYGMNVCAHETCNCEHPIIDESSDEESSDEEINEEVQFFGSDEEE